MVYCTQPYITKTTTPCSECGAKLDTIVLNGPDNIIELCKACTD